VEQKELKKGEKEEKSGKEAMRLHSEKRAFPRRGNTGLAEAKLKPSRGQERWPRLLGRQTV
jgi:hypothetical protein